MYLVFTCMSGKSCHWQHNSLLLCICDVFQALINSLVHWFCHLLVWDFTHLGHYHIRLVRNASLILDKEIYSTYTKSWSHYIGEIYIFLKTKKNQPGLLGSNNNIHLSLCDQLTTVATLCTNARSFGVLQCNIQIQKVLQSFGITCIITSALLKVVSLSCLYELVQNQLRTISLHAVAIQVTKFTDSSIDLTFVCLTSPSTCKVSVNMQTP